MPSLTLYAKVIRVQRLIGIFLLPILNVESEGNSTDEESVQAMRPLHIREGRKGPSHWQRASYSCLLTHVH